MAVGKYVRSSYLLVDHPVSEIWVLIVDFFSLKVAVANECFLVFLGGYADMMC